jgi:hypothetical protein
MVSLMRDLDLSKSLSRCQLPKFLIRSLYGGGEMFSLTGVPLVLGYNLVT